MAFRIASNEPLRQRQPRLKDEKHLRFLRLLDCIICGSPHTEAAHVRYAAPEYGKRETGKQEKPDDKWCLPLCSHHHRDQHAHSEEAWWNDMGINPLAACIELYDASGDDIEGQMVIMRHRK